MSAQKSTKLFSNKTVLKTGMNIVMGQGQRLFGTAPKPLAATAEHVRVTRKTPASLTARSPQPLTQAMSGAKDQKPVRSLPTHQHTPYALMPPMTSAQLPNKYKYQNEILNGRRRPFEVGEQCGSNCLASENGRQFRKLVDLMEEHKAKEQRRQDLEDEMWSSAEHRLNFTLDMPSIPKRSSQQRQAAKRVVAKEQGPADKPEMIAQEIRHERSSKSATYQVASSCLNTTIRLQETPRRINCQKFEESQRQQKMFKPTSITFPDSTSTPPDMTNRRISATSISRPDVAPPKRSFPKPGTVSITNPTDISSRKQQSIMNTVRPDYGNVAALKRDMPSIDKATSSSKLWITRRKSILHIVKPANGDAKPPKYPVNVVRPDIPPTNFSTQNSESALNLQKAREERLEQSTKSHKNRLCKFMMSIASYQRR